MEYTSRWQGISMGGISMGISMELAERDHSGCGGSLRYGFFSRSLTSCAEVAKPMGWTIHSTVPFPMLEHRETVHQLSRSGSCTSTTTAVFGTTIFRWVRDRSPSGES